MSDFPVGVDKVRLLAPHELPALCELAQLVFHSQGSQPANHLFGPAHFHAHEWWVAEAAGALVGTAGFLARRTCSATVELDWAIILSVATHPQWQGRGIMSSILRQGIADTDARGIPLSFLRGKRTRYTRFGWIEAGHRLGCTLSDTEFTKPNWPETAVKHYAGTGIETEESTILGEQLSRLQRAQQGNLVRSVSAQAAMVARHKIHTFYVERAGAAAYAIVGEPQAIALGWPPGVKTGSSRLLWLYELAGSPELAADLVGYILHENNGPLHYLANPDLSPLDRTIWQRAGSFGIVTCGMIRIHNLSALLNSYTKWWQSKARATSGSVVLQMHDGDLPDKDQIVRLCWTPAAVTVEPICAVNIHYSEPLVQGDRSAITLAIFGPIDPVAALPGEKDACLLRELFPLPLDLPRLDQI